MENNNPPAPVVVRESDGMYKIGDARYVPESDLLAVKGGATKKDAEWEGKLKALNTEWEGKVNEASAKHNTATQEVLKLQAQIEDLGKRLSDTAGVTTDLTNTKSALDAAKLASEGHATKALELMRQLIQVKYNVKPDMVAKKTMEELTMLEVALQAVGGGTGRYAVPPAGGGAGEVSPMDRAKKALEKADAVNYGKK